MTKEPVPSSLLGMTFLFQPNLVEHRLRLYIRYLLAAAGKDCANQKTYKKDPSTIPSSRTLEDNYFSLLNTIYILQKRLLNYLVFFIKFFNVLSQKLHSYVLEQRGYAKEILNKFNSTVPYKYNSRHHNTFQKPLTKSDVIATYLLVSPQITLTNEVLMKYFNSELSFFMG